MIKQVTFSKKKREKKEIDTEECEKRGKRKNIVLLTNLSDVFFRVFVLNKPTQTQNKTNFKQSMQTATDKMQTNKQTQPVNRYCIYTYIRYSLESREKELFFGNETKK